ncbi:MAG: hypothetical protein M1438_12280, partial [Deltaproteobacteria bacterium]|nr:hypothetical protein [Deltaproteobacteria bacterium]
VVWDLQSPPPEAGVIFSPGAMVFPFEKCPNISTYFWPRRKYDLKVSSEQFKKTSQDGRAVRPVQS